MSVSASSAYFICCAGTLYGRSTVVWRRQHGTLYRPPRPRNVRSSTIIVELVLHVVRYSWSVSPIWTRSPQLNRPVVSVAVDRMAEPWPMDTWPIIVSVVYAGWATRSVSGAMPTNVASCV